MELKMENSLVKKLEKRTVKSFMDLLILSELRNGPMSGYDAIGYIHKKFGILVSSGTVYALLYSLERDGLIKGTWSTKKRVYELTETGEHTLESLMKANGPIIDLLKNIILNGA